ncbi:hypothetical protein TTHERM_00787280 (macronuclear) [Tetrahymena thermophila SB210]|uniref:Uncharacterized protein n=1 Tax=Tetrahymena thermophila (strain SB210) TaxID=312017 RepID=Q23ZD5_TETTS|nr:hypothetical protein TTHERM_00787280 [Tetrahymena thermophila SB210]EAS01922.1 hypothetical protein TTHERM_00787280 [Tetrahymena thermophila SB210]|eukprot:XP_001022167.1 hypothetical protein TTHERM_00787280 [Tetrahymena thermophila SB210]
MYNYQNTRIETRKGQFKAPSTRIVQVLRKKENLENDANAPDIVTLHRSLQRIIVKEVNKRHLFEKTKFLPNSCEDQYFTAIDPVEIEDYTKIYKNVQQIIKMDPAKIKKVKEVVDQQRQEKEREKALFEQQIKQYKFQRKNIVKQRMQSILDKHNKHQNNNVNLVNNNNVPKKQEAFLKVHDKTVLNNLNEMYTNQPQSISNPTTVQKVAKNLTQYEKTKNNLISQTKVPYQQIIKMSNNSVLMAKCKKRSYSTQSEISQGLKQQNYIHETADDQENKIKCAEQLQQEILPQNQEIKILQNTQESCCITNIIKRHSATAPSCTPRTNFQKFKSKNLELQESEQQTYYNPAHTTLQSTLNQSKTKQQNQTISPDYYSTSQKWLVNDSSLDQFKMRNTYSLNKLGQRSIHLKKDNSKSSSISKEKTSINAKHDSSKNLKQFYLTECVQKTENDENDQNYLNLPKKERKSTSFEPSQKLKSEQTDEQAQKNQKNKEEKQKQRNPMKQYYDVDADNENKENERKLYRLDVPFDQFQRKYNISLNTGKPKKLLIELPSLEKELKLKGIKRQQEEQQKRQKMNLNLNQLEEFKGFKFPINDSQVLPIKNHFNSKLNQLNNSNSAVIFNGSQSFIGQMPNSATNNMKQTFNIFYKGQQSQILKQKNRKKSDSNSFLNFSKLNSIAHSKEQSLLLKQQSISMNNPNNCQNNQLSCSPSPNKQNQFNLSLNTQEFDKSELLLIPQASNKKINNSQEQNNSLISMVKMKHTDSPYQRDKSSEDVLRTQKQSIILKKDNNGRLFQNQVSFTLSESPNIVIQQQINDRYSPLKQHQNGLKNIGLQLNDFRTQNNSQQDYFLNSKKSNSLSMNDSRIIQECPDTQQSLSTRFQRNKFFDKFIQQDLKNDDKIKSEEMLINKRQKIAEQTKSNKFKKLVNKTHQCEDRVIDACRSFYVKKKEKNQELFQLFLTHYRDRPKTQEIRSRNYSCSSSGRQRFNLQEARDKSENDRMLLTKINESQQQFYKQLVNKLIMKSNSGDNMNICIYFMNAFKTVLEDLDLFEDSHFYKLLDNIENKDTFFYNPTSYFMITSVLDNLSLPFSKITQFKKLSKFVTYYQNLETEQQKTISTVNPENQQKLTTDEEQFMFYNQESLEDLEDSQD